MEAGCLNGPPAERPLKRIVMDNWISMRSPLAARVPATSPTRVADSHPTPLTGSDVGSWLGGQLPQTTTTTTRKHRKDR